MTFYFFSIALFENDFRKPLIEALQAKGHEVWHVRIGLKTILTGGHDGRREFIGLFEFVRFLKHARTHLKSCNSPVVFVDRTGAFVPLRALLLRASLRGLWCFDIFDNLLYDSRGLYRLKRRVAIFVLARLSPIKIVLSGETLRLFPDAHHLDNAAHTHRVSRAEGTFRDFVSLFMIDGRFDFPLVREVMALAPDLKLHLYGRLSTNDPLTQFQLEDLCSTYPNAIYRGEYAFDDVDTILAPFGIGFAPYITDSSFTEFINPDKYYLFLKSGMEVISTDIPQARRMEDRVHIVRSASDVVAIVAQIQSDPSFRKNKSSGDNLDWEKRADEFIGLIVSHTRHPM